MEKSIVFGSAIKLKILAYKKVRWQTRPRALAGLVLSAAILVLAAFSHLNIAAQDAAEPDDPVAVFNRAQDVHEKGDLTGAIELYKKALQIEPQFPEAEYQRGMAELALGRTGDAEMSLRRALELRPDWTLAMTNLGSLLVTEGKFAEAEKLLSTLIEMDSRNAAALSAMVELRIKTNADPSVLRELLAKVTGWTGRANPSAAVWTARAAIERAVGDREAAQASLTAALSIDGKYRPAHYQVVEMALEDGDIERAKDSLRTAQGVSAETEPLIILKAKLLAAEGDNDGAVKLLDPIAARSAAARELRDRLTAQNVSAAELEKRLADDPENVTLLGRLCSGLRRDDPKRALNYCRKASEAKPENLHFALGYAAALVQARQYETAVKLLTKIIEFAPDNWTAHANLATALFQLKRYPEAKPEFSWLTSKQSRLPAAYFFLAITFDQLGEYLDAVATYQQYLQLADPIRNKPDIDKVTLRLPQLQKLIKEGKGKRRNERPT